MNGRAQTDNKYSMSDDGFISRRRGRQPKKAGPLTLTFGQATQHTFYVGACSARDGVFASVVLGRQPRVELHNCATSKHPSAGYAAANLAARVPVGAVVSP